ncbi:unnamed protein product [Caenorhabditis auriculariae]|uniref:Solute carrier family 25 member 51 n=1 Tax=Caenorhabditis auriculariae TaxID=2777116 RepID=A0A8S1H7M0_9PELO|nr:unnamed protein product [Caenorhabditis auriculariae]
MAQLPAEKRKHLDFFCGWGAGCIETCLLYPTNKIIFRQQLHGFSAKAAALQIKNEGVVLLYRGLLPPLLMRTTSRALMFGLFDEFQSILQCPRAPPHSTFSLCHAQAAFLAGVVEATLCPLERIQCILQTSAYNNRFKNTLDVVKELRPYGFREYYRGYSVVVVRNALSNSMFFTLRDPLKKIITESARDSNLSKNVVGAMGDFFAGAILGAMISTIFFPVGVVKTNMQSKYGVPFENPFRVFRQLIVKRDDSLRGIYHGVYLNFTRSMLTWGITNTAYGVLRKLIVGDD